MMVVVVVMQMNMIGHQMASLHQQQQRMEECSNDDASFR